MKETLNTQNKSPEVLDTLEGLSELNTLKFTVFPDLQATEKIEREITWPDVVAMTKNPTTYPNKRSCPLLVLGTFGEVRTGANCLRSAVNLLTVTGIDCDYDGGSMPIVDAADALNLFGIRAVLYTSASHTPDRPRWRILLPLSRPHKPAERHAFVARVNGLLGGVLAVESFTQSQSYYFGKVAGAAYEARETQGQCIDELTIYAAGAIGPAQHAEKTADLDLLLPALDDVQMADLRSAALYLAAKKHGDKYPEWASCGMALKAESRNGCEPELKALWLEYSRECGGFESDETALQKWAQLPGTKTGRGAVFKRAEELGWINPASGRALATAETRQDRTDMGNVALLAGNTNGNLRYVPERKTWLWWGGHCWTPDTTGTMAQTAALQVAEHYIAKADEIRKQIQGLDDIERKRIEATAKSVEAWAAQCRNKQRLDSMLSLAKTDARFALPVTLLDKNPFQMGVENGVIDLKTGTLREAGRDDYVTKRSPVKFDPTSPAPRWTQFINEITSDTSGIARPKLAKYVQLVLGYCLTGSTAEQKMFIATGRGSNGKNVLLDMLQSIMGDYCETILPEALMTGRKDLDAERAMPGMRKLAGARVAISSESKDGQKLDVAMVKRHTGGGYMTARGLHENAFTFEITHKLWLMTNHKPSLDHMDDAMRGRLHMIPFDRRWNRPGHPERDPALPDGDKTLPDKLKLEIMGILAWLVAGAVAYTRDGLEPPAEVVAMTRAYFKDQDPFSMWLDTCEILDSKQGGLAAELHRSCADWCNAQGFAFSDSQVTFSAKLTSRGIEGTRSNTGKRYGLRAGGDLF